LSERRACWVGLAEGAVDGASFGDAHLGAVDQGRDVGGIGVTVTVEFENALATPVISLES